MYTPSGQPQVGWDHVSSQPAAYTVAPTMQGAHQPGSGTMSHEQLYAPSTSYPVSEQQVAAYPPPPGYPGQHPISQPQQSGPYSNYQSSGSAGGQAGPVDPEGQGDESSRGLGTFMMNQGHSLAHAGRTLHFVAHPTQAVQHHTTGKVKRKVHQAVGKALSKVLPW
jgi:hypothetical protein